MTEYEIASLFYQVLGTAHAALANFLTVVFAVLVVTYLAASHLDRTVSVFLFLVYSLFALGMSNEIIGLYSDLVRLAWEMAGYPEQSFQWHGMVSSLTEGPAWFIPTVVGSMCLLAYLGSLLFFYRMRRRSRQQTG